MTDRDALRTMLIYAQREAEEQDLPSVADLLLQAIARIEKAALPVGASGDGMIRTDTVSDAEYHGNFVSRRLQ